MICFNRLWETMKRKNISTYYLREKSGIDSKTVRRLKNNENIETKTLDKLCRALDCDITDILEYVKE
ncbi:MAG TPA: XRE family transcriptional regulator [Ruminococcaceae bacterium]|nr:XRE family transcriptional regulator [Oscillospiraceae bacterium]HCD80731.1 XRE family transcriptional regulator [Oscillospiraceae bacterium]